MSRGQVAGLSLYHSGPAGLDLVWLETRGWKYPFGNERTWSELTSRHMYVHAHTHKKCTCVYICAHTYLITVTHTTCTYDTGAHA